MAGSTLLSPEGRFGSWSRCVSGADPSWRYLLVNAGLPFVQFDIAGLARAAGAGAMNGSLWTLSYEAFCYAVVGFLGFTALLRRRPWTVPALCLLVWGLAGLDAAGL